MKKRRLPRILTGIVISSLLAGGVVAWAETAFSSDIVAAPDLYSIYKQIHSPSAASIKLTSIYIDTLISQQEMDILQERIHFYQDELKQAKSNAGWFSHVDPQLTVTLNSEIDLARAAYFGAKIEWQQNLRGLNQVSGDYYEKVKPISEHFYLFKPAITKKTKSIRALVKALQAERVKIKAEKEKLIRTQYAYNNGQAKVNDLIEQGLKYFETKAHYWNVASNYLHALANLDLQQKQIGNQLVWQLNAILYDPRKIKNEHEQVRRKLAQHRKRRHKLLAEKRQESREKKLVQKSIRHKQLAQKLVLHKQLTQKSILHKQLAQKLVLHKQFQHKLLTQKPPPKKAPLIAQQAVWFLPPEPMMSSPSTLKSKPKLKPKEKTKVKSKIKHKAKAPRQLVKLPMPKVEMARHYQYQQKQHYQLAHHHFYILPAPVSTKSNLVF